MRLKTIQYFLKKRPWLGDNFFKTAATLTIEVVCSKSYEDMTEKLRDVEAQILRKRNELRQFETDYQVLACFREVTNRYSQKKQSVDELLKQQDNIHSSFTITRTINSIGVGSGLNNGSGKSRESSLRMKLVTLVMKLTRLVESYKLLQSIRGLMEKNVAFETKETLH